MTNLRRFNEQGIAQFTAFLDSLRSATPCAYPTPLLMDPACTEEIHPPITIEMRDFGTRYEAAEYLFTVFKDSPLTGIERDQGLWAWLSFFYFDCICPVVNGKRLLRQRERYFPDLSNYRRYYKHSLAGSYLIYSAHQDNPRRVLSFLCVPLHILTDIIEHLAGRLELITNKSLIQTATTLYYNEEDGRLRRGARGKGLGSPKRLAAIMEQFDVTWDLYSLEARDVIGMLPSEFSRFAANQVG